MTETATAPPTPKELLNRIKWDVYRLAIPTQVPASLTGARGSRITRDPLLSDLRSAIKPNQGGTESGKSASSSERIPFDADALQLYGAIAFEISAMYETGTDRTAVGTPEQLLIEWWIAFLTTPQKTLPMLENYHDRLSRWRSRIESHFIRPRSIELGLCPSCGYTHHDTVVDGEVIRQRTLIGTWWPDKPERGYKVDCRYCGRSWTSEEQAQLKNEIENATAYWGPITYALAPRIIDTPPTEG